jgi:Family of unknown function (DUF6152)
MKRMKRLVFSAVTAGLLMLSSPGLAHHGNAAYDQKSPITIKGTVTEFAWANPHVQIYLDSNDDLGSVVHWACETVSPGLLVRAGWTRHELKPGDEITITLNPAKGGAPVGYVVKIVLPDGRELKLGPGRDRRYHGS